MKLKTLLLFFLLSLVPVYGLAQAQVGEAHAEAMQLIEQNRKLVDQGKFLEAKKSYEKILESGRLEKKDRRLVRKDYEKLNIKMIFSPISTPDSVMHTVTEGDSLYYLAKKHNTTMELIKKSNKLKSDTIYRGKKLKIQKGFFSVMVDKSDNILKLYLDDKLIRTYRVATGENSSTPVGAFKIVTKVANPVWYHEGAAIPHNDPKNILGTRWLGFDKKSYGIHGTTLPDTIGQQMSSGCVRMLNWEVEELYDILPLGTEVKVQD